MTSRDSFRGIVPVTPCRYLSGESCDLTVSADDEKCPAGHLLHRRALPNAALPVSGERYRRPRLAVTEDWDEVGARDPATLAANVIARPEALAVSAAALEAFVAHHGVDEERARGELRLLVARALAEDAYKFSPKGFWQVSYEKFFTHLTPEATAVLSYDTLHYERMPSEVFDGTPTRFGAQRKAKRRWLDETGQHTDTAELPKGQLADEELAARLQTRVLCSERLAAVSATRMQLTIEQAAAEICHAVQRALAAKVPFTVSPEKDDTRLLTFDGTCWVVSRNNGGIIASFPALGGSVSGT